MSIASEALAWQRRGALGEAVKRKRPAAPVPPGVRQMRRLQLGGDGREGRGQIGADRTQHGDGGNCNQSSDKSILNRRSAVLILQKLGQSRKHNGYTKGH